MAQLVTDLPDEPPAACLRIRGKVRIILELCFSLRARAMCA